MSISDGIKVAGKAIVKHKADILFALGLVCEIGAVVTSAAGTTKAVRLLEEERKCTEIRTPAEVTKTVWKCYIPTVALTVASAACLIFSHKDMKGAVAATAAACTMTETAFSEYRTKIRELFGAEKEHDAMEEAACDKMVRTQPDREIIVGTDGESLCFDALSGRYFQSSVNALKKIENELNARLLREDCLSANEYFYEIGLPEIPAGEYLGWNAMKGLIELRFSTRMSDNDIPCIVVWADATPEYNYK